jgi:hypothetical protein
MKGCSVHFMDKNTHCFFRSHMERCPGKSGLRVQCRSDGRGDNFARRGSLSLTPRNVYKVDLLHSGVGHLVNMCPLAQFHFAAPTI